MSSSDQPFPHSLHPLDRPTPTQIRRDALLEQAMLKAVEQDMPNWIIMRCPMCFCKDETLHAVHHEPSFRELKRDFLKQTPFFPKEFADDPYTVFQFVDKWRAFNRQHATYIMICEECGRH